MRGFTIRAKKIMMQNSEFSLSKVSKKRNGPKITACLSRNTKLFGEIVVCQ